MGDAGVDGDGCTANSSNPRTWVWEGRVRMDVIMRFALLDTHSFQHVDGFQHEIFTAVCEKDRGELVGVIRLE